DRPEPVEDYDIEHLTGDLIGLLDHLQIDKAIFVGHDWGGFIVWQMPLRHIDRVAGVVGINTPHTNRAWADPIELLRARFGEKVFVDNFTRTGFTGGINWYRNMSRNWTRAEGLDHTVRVPSLMIMAENDAVLPPSSADGMDKLIPDLEKYLVRDSGHWTQQEKPEEVSAKLIEWRRRRFG